MNLEAVDFFYLSMPDVLVNAVAQGILHRTTPRRSRYRGATEH